MVGLKRSDCFINNYLNALMTENWQERDNHRCLIEVSTLNSKVSLRRESTVKVIRE